MLSAISLSECEGRKLGRVLSFGTGVAPAGPHPAPRPTVVPVGSSCWASALSVTDVIVTVAVVLHTQDPVTIILEQSGIVQLQVLQLLPQLVPLLLLLLLPVQVTFQIRTAFTNTSAADCSPAGLAELKQMSLF